MVRIPAVQTRLALDARTLGLVLLGLAVGALLAMPVAGAMMARTGSRRMTRGAALALAAALPLPALAPSPLLLAGALVLLGGAGGVLGVAMNAQAAEVERLYGRPLMSGFHALFSAGGLVGAGIGGVAAQRGIDPAPHLLGAAAALVVLALAAGRHLLPTPPSPSPDRGARRSPRLPAGLLALGAVAFCVLFAEGAMADWSAVYLRDVAGAGPGLTAAGFGAFSLAMAAGRVVGDRVLQRIGAERLVRGGGTVAAVGVALAVLLGTPWAAVLGFGLVGAGLSAVFPTVLATAGRAPGLPPAAAIAAVSTVGYTGFMAGPPLIGLVADALSLRAGLALVVVAAAVVALAAGALRGGAPPPIGAPEAPEGHELV